MTRAARCISALAPAVAAVVGKYEAARVLMTVAPHIRLRPACHGIKVRPSGPLPSDRSKPGGSLMVRKPTFDQVIEGHCFWLFCRSPCKVQKRP